MLVVEPGVYTQLLQQHWADIDNLLQEAEFPANSMVPCDAKGNVYNLAQIQNFLRDRRAFRGGRPALQDQRNPLAPIIHADAVDYSVCFTREAYVRIYTTYRLPPPNTRAEAVRRANIGLQRSQGDDRIYIMLALRALEALLQ
jgi:hypothetical protein